MKTAIVLCALILLAGIAPASAQTMQVPAVSDSVTPATAADKCSLAPQRGPCKAMFERYYYNAKEKKCAGFFWGGCGGVVPFETQEECEKQCLPPQALRISEIKTVGDIYAEVSLEFPKTWDDRHFAVQVDGRDVNARPYGGGFSQDRNMQSLIFFPGKPGAKKVTVTATMAGRPVKADGSFNWPGRPFVAALGFAGDRLLVRDNRKISVVIANLGDVTIKLNGDKTDPRRFGSDAVLYTIDPVWKQGVNTLSVEGTGADGTPVIKKYVYVYPGEGGIRQGESVLLDYGTEGTKSGPFFSLSVEGDAIVAGADRSADVYTIDDKGWIGREIRLVRELKAAKPGKAKVLVSEKPHFLQPRRLKEEIAITVLPAGQ